MNATSDRIDQDELRRRRQQIDQTLAYLKAERRSIEQNAPWMDPEAYRRRIILLNKLAAWYHAETAEINEALEDFRRN